MILMVILTQMITNTNNNSPNIRGKLHDAQAAVCSLWSAMGMSEGLVQMLKAYVGRLRPNFYSLCQFDATSQSCLASEENILESRMSFPSGHSSFSFTGMGILTLFLLGKYSSSSLNGVGAPKLPRLVCFVPLLYSTFVACSRLVDNWHHPSDIIAGSLIGLFLSWVGYHLW